jgi:hypothetical protein
LSPVLIAMIWLREGVKAVKLTRTDNINDIVL